MEKSSLQCKNATPIVVAGGRTLNCDDSGDPETVEWSSLPSIHEILCGGCINLADYTSKIFSCSVHGGEIFEFPPLTAVLVALCGLDWQTPIKEDVYIGCKTMATM